MTHHRSAGIALRGAFCATSSPLYFLPICFHPTHHRTADIALCVSNLLRLRRNDSILGVIGIALASALGAT
jgi:hypothetical protein